MKQLRLLLILAITCLTGLQLHSQKKIVWFDAGLKAQSGFTGFYNQAIVDSDNVDFEVTSSVAYGGKLGINKGYSGVALELLLGQTKGKFDHQDFVGTTNMELQHMDFYVLFRNAKNLGFFEIGPKFSFVRSAEYFRASPDQPVAVTDVTDDFRSGISGVLSFGANLIGNEGRFSGQLGLRLEYGFKNIVSDRGLANNSPVYIDGLYANGNKGTHPIFAGIVFELNWGIGYYGMTKCGGRTKFFMF